MNGDKELLNRPIISLRERAEDMNGSGGGENLLTDCECSFLRGGADGSGERAADLAEAASEEIPRSQQAP